MTIKNIFKKSLLPYIAILVAFVFLFLYSVLSNIGFLKYKERYLLNLNFMHIAAENSTTPVYLVYKDKKTLLNEASIKKIKYYISQVTDKYNIKKLKEAPDAVIMFGQDEINMFKINNDESIVLIKCNDTHYAMLTKSNDTWGYMDYLVK